MALKRLQKEYADISQKPYPWCQVSLADGSNMMHWKIVIAGPEKTPYEKGNFTLDVEIPDTYPFKPPKMKFTTKIYHPNVKTSTGEICQEVLFDSWSPQLRISEVLLTIRQLMSEPNTDNPLEPEIANLYKSNRSKFDKTAKEWTSKWAK
eukprot:CAMPEP_0177640174 /NCGR_PEP_ID=MMETSP0447-20121125/6405_1 /TAXON_ID=0 /ORGANISM="Stygamoeba regulata, Strain BSH-02190019" /LENGTH=149 /DNA_ID=CAMNT_0019142233 /DNA_START=43 /DNA_END=492 /DNA_ORIENTATION=-